MTPRSHYPACEGRELQVTEWGAGQPEVVVAWHGQDYQLAFFAHYDLWPAWDALQIPVLALRGAHSDLHAGWWCASSRPELRA